MMRDYLITPDKTDCFYDDIAPKRSMHYGIWSPVMNSFVFDIDEPTKMKAWKALKDHPESKGMRLTVRQHGGTQ